MSLVKNLNLINANGSLASNIFPRISEIRKEKIKRDLTNFKDIEHRLEFISNKDGVNYINDSRSTNVNSTWYSLEITNGPIIWIAGGIDKRICYENLIPHINKKVKAIITLGLNNEKLKNTFSKQINDIYQTKKMSEAISYAFQLSKKGDTVLLSPACASFDLFENYEDMGNQFKYWVNQI